MPFIFPPMNGGRPPSFCATSVGSATLQEYLETLIENYGGVIVRDPTEADFDLVDPRDEDRFVQSPNTVCYTFVRTCIEGIRGYLDPSEYKNLWPILVISSGEPLSVFIHESVDKHEKRTLNKKITQCGGRRGTEDNFQVILADGQPLVDLQKQFVLHPDITVHPPSWIDECLEEHRLRRNARPLKRLPGSKRGAVATKYTEDDDRHLVDYVARKCPYKETKGRAGEKIYKDLCADLETYPWAERHSWQSWLNHYKKQQEYFDTKIAHHIHRHPDIKTKWSASSAYSKKAARAIGIPTYIESEDDLSDLDDRHRTPTPSPSNSDDAAEVLQLVDSDGDDELPREPGPSKLAKKKAPSRRLQSSNSYNDFPDLREGDDRSAPEWAKRKRSAAVPSTQVEVVISGTPKKLRTARQPVSDPDNAAEEHSDADMDMDEIDELDELDEPSNPVRPQDLGADRQSGRRKDKEPPRNAKQKKHTAKEIAEPRMSSEDEQFEDPEELFARSSRGQRTNTRRD